jgi:uncharacterized protein YbjT (DUF2867 family)
MPETTPPPDPATTTIAVFSASARPGLAQVRTLLDAGYRVRAITRQAVRNPLLRLDGVEVMAADLNDTASLDRACDGVAGVFYTAPTFTGMEDVVDQSHALGLAAARAGVRRLVYNTTSWHPDEPVGVPTMVRGYEKTKALQDSGVRLTVVRPSLFMDNLLTKWVKPYLLETGEFSYPHDPELRVSWICLDDVAAFMLATFERPDMEGEIIDVGGPEVLRPGEVADKLSVALGRPIVYRQITPREFGERMYDVFHAVAGVDRETYVSGLERHYQFKNVANPFLVPMDDLLRRLPVALTPMSTWLARQDWSDAAHDAIGSVSG